MTLVATFSNTANAYVPLAEKGVPRSYSIQPAAWAPLTQPSDAPTVGAVFQVMPVSVHDVSATAYTQAMRLELLAAAVLLSRGLTLVTVPYRPGTLNLRYGF